MPRRRLTLLVTFVALLAVCCALGVQHLFRSPSTESPAAAESATTDQAGPHSPTNRTPAKTTVEHSDGVVVHDFDLGDVSLGGRGNAAAFRAPVRGVLVIPDTNATPGTGTTPDAEASPDAEETAAPLVIISHLRTFGCADETFRYPCLPGVKEVRADRGMIYLGKALAAQGYAVLIPDLSPLWSGEETATPYDQVRGWLLTVGRMRDELLTASSGGATVFGAGMRGVIRPGGAALIMHSRSAAVFNPVVDAWKDSPTPITSLMTYGGDFVIPDGPDPDFSPPPPADVPFLVVDGDADRDVKQAGTIWLTEHITQQRSAPAIGVRVRGYGHNYINRELSGRGFDDRVIDGDKAPDAAAHEALLTKLSSQWLEQTLRGGPGPFPTSSDAPLPETLADVPVQWLVAAPGDAVNWTATSGKNTDGAVEAVGGGQVKLCRTYASMDPNQYPDRCPDPENGVQSIRSTTARISLSRGGGARLSVQASDVQGVHLHLAPTGSRSDQLTHTPVQVALVMDDGSRLPLTLLGSDGALRDLRTAEENGDYTVATLRFSVPAQARGHAVTSVELLGGEGDGGAGEGSIDLRGVSLIRSTR